MNRIFDSADDELSKTLKEKAQEFGLTRTAYIRLKLRGFEIVKVRVKPKGDLEEVPF